MMKSFSVILIFLGVFVLMGGVGYSVFLMSEQSRQTYECKTADLFQTRAEKAEEAYKAAKGTPQGKELEKELKQQLNNEQLAIRACSESKSFYKTRIALGFLIAGVGFVISLVGLGAFLFGRKRSVS